MKFPLPKVGLPKVGRPHAGPLATVPTRLRPGDRFERYAWFPVGIAVATVVVLVAVFSDALYQSDVTMIIMGFDQDRAQLISALIFAAAAAAAVGLVVNRDGFATLLGAYALAAMYAQTFVTETQTAVAASGAAGSFALGGWILTLVTLAVIAVVCSWAAATVAVSIRPALIASAAAVREMVQLRRPTFTLARKPLGVVLMAVLLVVTVPAFGDMVNFTPDSLMLNGDRGGGLSHEDASFPDVSLPPLESDSPSPSADPTVSADPSAAISNASPTPTPTPHTTAAPGSKPWLAWKPSGEGHVTTVQLNAPWKGGSKSTSTVDIYTPPGYQPNGSRRYPVLFEAPTGLALWGQGTGVIGALDTLIDSGEIPATIVVFIDSSGAPHPDTECADHIDGSQWFETYITTTVQTYVNRHYRTIEDPRARGIMGMSAGGFCAPMLALRHPDLFSISISFSGYFWAGAGGATSLEPFGDQTYAYALHSPVSLAAKMATEDRNRVYLVIIANKGQEFYASAADNFEKVLTEYGYKYLAIDSLYVHGWTQVRYDTPAALDAWAAQLVVNGNW
jgi:enterochelin esterase-like enzyme